MANTIGVEAKRQRQLSIDVDKHRRRYVKTENDITIQFVSPIIETFELYRFYLLKHSIKKEIDETFYFKPDYVSFDEYGTVTLWPLLLYINDIASIEEFNKPSILVPSYESILEVTRKNELNTTPIDIDLLNTSPSIYQQTILYSSKVSPKLKDLDVQEPIDEVPEVYYVRQKFTLTAVNIFNKFVDLSLVPIIESVDLKILFVTMDLIYDVHYTLIENTNGEIRRLSWSDDDNVLGEGLETILQEGDTLEVQFARN